jgi:lipopolysaccharide/colanic/teichoic acid biosynthesis glycosyltransferase
MRARLDEACRRLLDIGLAGSLLLIAAPVLLVIALLVKADSRGSVLFTQQRVGRGGTPFGLLKFRTMVADVSGRGRAITVGVDPRITKVGTVLRRYKLDELPQLWNVLRGDMGLVGPRPEVPTYVAGYTAEQREVLAVRPGITDPASLIYSDESTLLATFADPERAYVEEILPRKLALSRAYLQRRTFFSDLAILVRTALRLLGPPPEGEVGSRG